MVKLYWHILFTKTVFRQAAKLLAWCRVWYQSSVVHLNFLKWIFFYHGYICLPASFSFPCPAIFDICSTSHTDTCDQHHSSSHLQVNTWKIKMEFNKKERSSVLRRLSLENEDRIQLFEIEKKTGHLSCTSSPSWIQCFSCRFTVPLAL